MTSIDHPADRRGLRWGGLDEVQKLIVVIVPLGLLHHADHVGRADHSSWPFRSEIGPFTFTLLIYPVLVVAFLARKGSWLRAVSLGIVALFTLVAHTLIEPPGQIYGTWANNLSTDAPLYTVDPEHMHNLLDRELPLLGNLATILSVTLTGLLLIAAVRAIRDTRTVRAAAPAHINTHATREDPPDRGLRDTSEPLMRDTAAPASPKN
jgi:hypothetical protein